MTEIIPEAFVCPLTGKVFSDPVVVPDGTTHERSAVISEKCYPNRALRRMIEESVVFPSSDDEEGAFHWLECIRMRWVIPNRSKELDEVGEFDDNLELNGPWYRPPAHIPPELVCPITSDLLLDPVIDPEGHSFDRQSLLEWLRREGTSPITRQPLSAATLFPNFAVKEFLLKELSQREPTEMIQKWKRDEAFIRKNTRWHPRAFLRNAYRQEPLSMIVMWIVLTALGACFFYFVSVNNVYFQKL